MQSRKQRMTQPPISKPGSLLVMLLSMGLSVVQQLVQVQLYKEQRFFKLREPLQKLQYKLAQFQLQAPSDKLPRTKLMIDQLLKE